jgi:hypothetical protein
MKKVVQSRSKDQSWAVSIVNSEVNPLKEVSSEKKSGLKMVLIDVYGPGTVALGIFMSFYFVFILFLPYFRFRSVHLNL